MKNPIATRDVFHSELAIGNVIDELNQRARSYLNYEERNIEAAQKQAITDFQNYLAGVGYKVLSPEEVKANNKQKFFEVTS
jgi:predicted type IV restriction endonuclease